MSKFPSFISCLRPSRYGDIIASLPCLTYLEKRYPDSYKCAYIDLSCAPIAPFLLNQPYLNEIRISEKVDTFSDNDKYYFSKYDYAFNPYALPTDLEYFNKYHFCEEIFRMTTLLGGGRVNPDEYNILTEQEKRPYLHRWFPIERHEKTIAVWPKVGYNNKDETINLRSPSNEFWHGVYGDLIDLGYKVVQLGFSDIITTIIPVIDLRSLSLFDSIKFALGCDINICCDSGSGWILGAYGVNQILLYTNYKKNHTQNFNAICPVNYWNNCQYLYGIGGINNINPEDVLEAVRKFE